MPAEVDTKPQFRAIELNLKKLIGLFLTSDELLAHAAALESVVRQAFAEEVAFRIADPKPEKADLEGGD